MYKKLLLISSLAIFVAANWQSSPVSDQICDSNYYGYYWDGQKCEQCNFNNNYAGSGQQYCQCSSYNTCSNCPPGHFLNQNTQTCFKCQNGGFNGDVASCCALSSLYVNEVPTRATACRTSWTETLGTNPGNYPLGTNDGSSSSAQSAWLSTNSIPPIQTYGGYCYYLPYCQTYTDYGICLTCMPGYYLGNSNQCSKCPANCASCSGPSECDVCATGYYLASNNGRTQDDPQTDSLASNCVICNTGCACSSWSQLCTSCLQSNYFFTSNSAAPGNGTCAITSVSNCMVAASSSTCSQCDSGYLLDPAGKSCNPFTTANCLSGVYNNGAAQCNQCFNGFYLDANNNCNACPANVLRCKSLTVFTQCQQTVSGSGSLSNAPHAQAYFLITDNTSATICVKNVNNCKTMISNANSTIQGQCSACYTDLNYVLNSNNVCIQCGQSIPGCITCQANATNIVCTSCTSGFVLTNGTCTQCISNCVACTNSTACQTCTSGYGLTSSFTCQACINYCATCNTNPATTCDKCLIGYRAQNNTYCESCDENCNACDSNRKTCTMCATGYYLNGGVCVQERANCMNYGQDGTCISCSYGYRPLDGYCFVCYNGDVAGAGQGIGYINCPNDCTTDPTAYGGSYLRDGNLYTSTYDPNTEFNSGYILSVFFSVMFALLALIV